MFFFKTIFHQILASITVADDIAANISNIAQVTAEHINETKLNESEIKAIENKNKTWMDFEDFFVCFK